MNDPRIVVYPDRGAQMSGLAEIVADELGLALAAKGRATLAVPGGTTPEPFFRILSEADIAWFNVTVLLTDERVVPQDSGRSNTRLVQRALLQNKAAEANLKDFRAGALSAEAGLELAIKGIEPVLPLDVMVLGLGEDLHTASLIPRSPELEDALADDAPRLMFIHPPGYPEARLTLTGPVLRGARSAHILINGAGKKAALERAMEPGTEIEAPVRTVLNASCPVKIHYAD